MLKSDRFPKKQLMERSPYSPPMSNVVEAIETRGFSPALRASLWGPSLMVCSAYAVQGYWRFPPLSVGARLTALMLIVGGAIGGIACVSAWFILIRRSSARTAHSFVLAAVNSILLLLALTIISAF